MIKTRSLRRNSLTSIFASGGVFFLTLITTALLARTISASDYKVYASVIAFLPLALLLSQSVRNSAGSTLIVSIKSSNGPNVERVYRRLIWGVVIFTATIGGAVTLIYPYISDGSFSKEIIFGIYSLLVYTSGITLSLTITGPSAALQDFNPENLLKIFPPILSFILFYFVYYFNPQDKIIWIFVCFAIGPWPLLIWLLLKYKKYINNWYYKEYSENIENNNINRSISKFMLLSFFSVIWWNLTAYFSSSVTIAIVAIMLPSYIVPFGMSFSLIGILSGGLIAISSPLASKIALLDLNDIGTRSAMFRRFNGYCTVYILAVSVFVLMLPKGVYELWVGQRYAEQVQTLTLYLMPAMIVRLQTMCFTLFVMGCGRQASLWLSPLLEAISATTASLILGFFFGIEGIAFALMLSAIVRLALTVCHDRRLNQDVLPLNWWDILFPRVKLRAR